ncbi:MAG TPA: hypothetical protein VI386_04635 [Candidatus Sulfotelmatobacter sp.]
MPIYKGARLKVKRANEHISELTHIVERLKKALLVTADIEPGTGCEFIKCDLAEIEYRAFDDLPAVLGDAIHNLKCALDHAWYETVTRIIPNGDWESTKFPAYATAKDVEAALRNREIHVSAPNFFTLITTKIQPHDRGDFAIRTVHKLDIRDKHTLLIPVVQYTNITSIRVADQDGSVWPGQTYDANFPFPHYLKFERGLHVKDPGRPSLEIMFKYGDFEREARAVEALQLYSSHILMIVELLEQFTES